MHAHLFPLFHYPWEKWETIDSLLVPKSMKHQGILHQIRQNWKLVSMSMKGQGISFLGRGCQRFVLRGFWSQWTCFFSRPTLVGREKSLAPRVLDSDFICNPRQLCWLKTVVYCFVDVFQKLAEDRSVNKNVRKTRKLTYQKSLRRVRKLSVYCHCILMHTCSHVWSYFPPVIFHSSL